MKMRKEIRYHCVLVALLFIVVAADWLTSAEVSVGPLYLFVVAYGAWNLGKLAGFITSAVCAGLWMILEVKSGHQYSQTWIIWENAGTRLLTYAAETYFVALYRVTLEAHRRRLAMLEQVLAVCPGCGRIGPQEGGWRRAEELHKVNGDRYKLCPICTSVPHPNAAANSARAEHA